MLRAQLCMSEFRDRRQLPGLDLLLIPEGNPADRRWDRSV